MKSHVSLTVNITFEGCFAFEFALMHYYFCQLKYIQEFQREKEAFEKNMARFKLVSMFQYKNT